MKNCSTEAACVSRREFLVKAGLVAGGTLLTISSVGSALAAAFEDVVVEIGADSALAKVGGYQIVDSTAGKIIVIHEDSDKFVAMSALCTHKGALVDYDAVGKKVICKKHGSAFDETTGAVLRGPADDPLKSYPAQADGKKVTVTVAK